jgi:4-hydroxy-tetrahydrodipicolinate reductase
MAGIRIGVVGCGGRMGRMLIGEIVATEGCTVAGGCEAPGSATIGRDIGELAGLGTLGLAVGGDRAALFAAADVVIDFTVPAASVAHAAYAASHDRALVIGTTGLDAAQTQAVKLAARQVPIMWAPNMSLAVTLLLEVVADVARRLGPDYDIEVLEMHHRDKVDAPSGTALALGRAGEGGRACATAIPGRGGAAISASPPCAAAMSPASTRSSSRPSASASSSATRRRAARSSPAAPSPRRNGSSASRPASTT